MNKQYKYDAFISYRHSELDKFVAETLHKELENYKVPGNILKKTNGRKKIQRVFRDQEELPLANNLEDPIKEALAQSEYLIVICTPRLKESKWCQKEIDTFIEMHGRKNIYVVLAEGEPDDVFPEQLRHGMETITHEDGTTEVVEGHWEPLAADVRGNNKAAVKKAIKSEMLRLLAPMFGVDYDDLRQRHRERMMRKVFTRAAVVTGVSLLFGIVSSGLAINIALQKNHIKKQNAEIKEQSAEIVAKNLEIRQQNDLLALKQVEMLVQRAETELKEDDREKALEDAYVALTGEDGIEFPYIAKAQEILTEALHVYDRGRAYQQAYILNVEGALLDAKPSASGKNIALNDSLDILYIYDVEEQKLLQRINDIASFGTGMNKFVFIEDDKLAFIAANDTVYIEDIDQGKNQVISGIHKARSVYSDPSDRAVWVAAEGALVKVDVDSLEIVKTIATDSDVNSLKLLGFSENKDKVIYSLTPFSADESQVVVADLNTGEEKVLLSQDYLGKVNCFDGRIYVVSIKKTKEILKNISVISCYDESTLELLWKKELEEGSADKIYQSPDENDHEFVMLEANDRVYTVRRETGEVVKHISLSSEIINVYRGVDRFVLFTRNGKMYIYKLGDEDIMENPYYDLYCENIFYTFACNGTFVVIPHVGKGALVLQIFNEDAGERYEGEIPHYEFENHYAKEILEMAEEYGFPDGAWIRDILTIEENKKVILCYNDGRALVYDLENKCVLRDLGEGRYNMRFVYGRDKRGYLLVGGIGFGYILNEEYDIVGVVDGMVHLLPEENKVVVERYSNEYYALPLYSLEELLAMAEEVVLE